MFRNHDYPNPDKPEPNRFEDKKIDHENTKARKPECRFISCFRDYVSQFSARKNTKIIAKILYR